MKTSQSKLCYINTQHKVKELRTTTPHSKTTGDTVNYIWESYLEKRKKIAKGHVISEQNCGVLNFPKNFADILTIISLLFWKL